MADRKKPRRRPGEGAITKRPNGTYAGVLNLGVASDGKRRRRWVYGRTEKEVLGKMNELRRQLTDYGDIPTADMRLEKWLTYWLAEIAVKRTKPSTYRSYVSAVEQYLTPSLGNRPLSRLTPAHVREMHRYVQGRADRNGKPLSSTTAHNAHRILAAALNDAVREGRVARNVAALVPAPAKAQSARRGMSWAEAVALLSHAPERTAARWFAAFVLGARQGELLGLRWEYVNLATGTAELAWSLQRVPYAHGCNPTCAKKRADDCPDRRHGIPAGLEHHHLDGNLFLLRPKSRTSQRVMPLPLPLLEALKLRHAQSAGEPNPHGLVWTRPDGRPIHPRDDWTEWRDLLAAAEITRHVTMHEARHSAATWMGELGTDERVARDLLGHSDVLMTRSYTHINQAQALAALDGIATRLAAPPVARAPCAAGTASQDAPADVGS